jgi:DNA excision repair protein ERCC-5
MEGKALAIDSSIWIYQFQATMRDKEGRALVNAHVLGFLRRICKLLFYGIKPVFVFDGGAPALKRNTIVRPEGSPSTRDRCSNFVFRLPPASYYRPSARGRRAARPSAMQRSQRGSLLPT